MSFDTVLVEFYHIGHRVEVRRIERTLRLEGF